MFEKEAKERARKIEENQTLGVYDSDEDYARDSDSTDSRTYEHCDKWELE